MEGLGHWPDLQVARVFDMARQVRELYSESQNTISKCKNSSWTPIVMRPWWTQRRKYTPTVSWQHFRVSAGRVRLVLVELRVGR